MAFSDEILKPATNKQALVRLDLKKRFEASEFVDVGGGVYAAPWPFPVYNSPGATYNYTERRLEVGSPVQIDTDFYVCLSSGVTTFLPLDLVSGQGDKWEGRISSAPTVSQDATNMLEGIISSTTSNMAVRNTDRKYNVLLSDNVIVKDQEIRTYFQVEDEIQLVAVNTCSSLSLQAGNLQINIRQSLQKLRKKAEDKIYPKIGDAPTENSVEPSKRGISRPYRYDAVPNANELQILPFNIRTDQPQFGGQGVVLPCYRPADSLLLPCYNTTYSAGNFLSATSVNHRWLVEGTLRGTSVNTTNTTSLLTVLNSDQSAVFQINGVDEQDFPAVTPGDTGYTNVRPRMLGLQYSKSLPGLSNIQIGDTWYTDKLGYANGSSNPGTTPARGIVVRVDINASNIYGGGFNPNTAVIWVAVFEAFYQNEKNGSDLPDNSQAWSAPQNMPSTFAPFSRWYNTGNGFYADPWHPTVDFSLAGSHGTIPYMGTLENTGFSIGRGARRQVKRSVWDSGGGGYKAYNSDPDATRPYMYMRRSGGVSWHTVCKNMLDDAEVSYNAASFDSAAAAYSATARFTAPYRQDSTIKSYWDYLGGLCANMGGFLKLKSDGNVYFQYWDEGVNVKTFIDNDILQDRIQISYQTDDLITVLEIEDGLTGNISNSYSNTNYQASTQDQLVKTIRGYLESYPKIGALTNILFKPKKRYSFSTYTQGMELEIGDLITLESKHLPDGKSSVTLIILKLTKTLNEVKIVAYEV